MTCQVIPFPAPLVFTPRKLDPVTIGVLAGGAAFVIAFWAALLWSLT
jgi:hypothetical protein